MDSDFVLTKNKTPSLLLNSKIMYKDLEKRGSMEMVGFRTEDM